MTLTFEQWFKRRYKRAPDVKGIWYDRDMKTAWDVAYTEGRTSMLPTIGTADGANSYQTFTIPKPTGYAAHAPKVGGFCKACGHFESDHSGCAAGPYCTVEGCRCVDGMVHHDMKPLYLDKDNHLTTEAPK